MSIIRDKNSVAYMSSIPSIVRHPYSRLVLTLALLLSVAFPVVASSLTPISQGYLTSKSVALGSIVSLDKNSSDHVSAATPDTASNMLGVVIDAGNSLLSLSNGQDNQIQVATSGVVQVLASDINGGISEGDSITASPISGVGMKATSNTKIVGIAQDDLNGTNSSSQSYKTKDGKSHSVKIGEIPMLVSVSYYYRQPDKTVIPSAVQSIANALAGKPVDPLPIIVSVGIFVITLVVVVSIIYSMIRSSIISVGRNPLSQAAVYRDLIQMSGLVLAILGVSVGAIYLVLTRL